MHVFASLALLLTARLVSAGVYVTDPVQASTCTGGGSCLVEWVDDGKQPTLSSIGECNVGLYVGDTLVQSLPSVNVDTTRSFTFTVNPQATADGPVFILFSAVGIDYQSYSGSFTLSGMTGTTPSGGSSVPASTPASTGSGLSTSAGTTVSGSTVTATATGTDTATTLSGTSTPTGSTTGSTTDLDTTSATGTTPTISATLTTPTATALTSTSPTFTSPTTSLTVVTASRVSTTTPATPSSTNAAARVGSNSSLGSLAVLLMLSSVLVF